MQLSIYVYAKVVTQVSSANVKSAEPSVKIAKPWYTMADASFVANGMFLTYCHPVLSLSKSKEACKLLINYIAGSCVKTKLHHNYY